jgi:hypothetical protein
MSEHEHAHEHHHYHHHHHDHHACANLFGCGDEKGTGIIREDIKDAVYDKRASDRLLHLDEVDQETFDGYLSARGRWRRKFLQASTFMGALAAVEPWFGRLARAQGAASPSAAPSAAAGRTHVVPSTKETVRLGVFDANLPPILTIESGDIISYQETWSHFLNEMQPGVSVETLAQLRTSNPGRGPHSIIGPIAVNGAAPGDVVEIRFQTIRPYEWAAVLNNPGALGTGLLPQDYAQGQIKYVDLDLGAMRGKFMPNINVPLRPFQGTFGLAPPDGYFPPLSPGRHQLGTARPARGESRPQRAVRGLDTLYTGVEGGRPHLHRRQPRGAGRRRDLPHRAGDAHEGGARPGVPA